ncbi:MAG: DNA translocase FtsK 4TM domain-containing protein [Deltaproteobacteria bacterium]|nr:DNA translocase FtsK 4TM domain-containing protein [Deltaproteobacteria bacterium]MBN2670204.1 DNA translocase FtsK 4TM domain-containing protein [Deltaproteobacteria bacterium]
MSKRSANSVSEEFEVPDELELEVPSRWHEVLGVIVTSLALVMALALFSYDGLQENGSPVAGGNVVGPAGTWMAFVFFSAFGAAAYMVNLAMWVFAACLFTGYAYKVSAKGVIGSLIIVVFSSIAMNSLLVDPVAGGHAGGGVIGGILGELLNSVLSTAGTYIVTFGAILLTLLIITDISLFLVGRTVGLLLLSGVKMLAGFMWRVAKAWTAELPEDEEEESEQTVAEIKAKRKKQKESPAEESIAEAEEKVEPLMVQPKIVQKTKPAVAKSDEPALPEINQKAHGDFQLPSLSMLAAPEKSSSNIDEQYLQDNAVKLMSVLKDFGITGEVKEIHPGPVVTMFEFQPRSGTKLSKIGSLSNEVAMALEVTRVRIVAPIPGKNAVGFELPNKEREMVRLREIFEDKCFAQTKAKLPMALGKDISGAPFAVDLAKMPHLLMAGTTGSGKSVSVNTMLLSFLYTYTPDELRLLLIDPKMIEFQPYNHIPHLLLPVVTDMSQACLALKWGVDEMERRYQLFADMGSKNLESYNNKVEKILEKAREKQETPLPAETAITAEGTVVEFGEEDRVVQPAKLPEKLPLIVICIDELADLMMVAAKDVENSIARLAQKARASGIHLIVATQRPSTDVVTGLIKANFPARLSCQVSSGIDSRTILGTNGAEHLLGNGDMLIIPPGTSDAIRVQGAFVSEEEVVDVVDFLKKQALPEYDDEILKPREDEGGGDVDDEEKDEMYDQAVAIVAEAQTCSISMLQRKLRIGYNRSARIVEIMEKEGVVGPANGVNKREVLISPQ